MERELPTLSIVIALVAGLLVGAIVVTTASPSQVNVSQQGTEDTISVTGDGQVEVEPDEVQIQLGVQVTEDTAEAARQENANRTDSVVEALKGIGVTEDQIETARFSIRPERSFDRDKGPQVTGYTATNTIRVTTQETDSAADIIDTAVASGANDVDQVSFTLTDETRKEQRKQAIEEAVSEAEDEAQTTAEDLGLSVKKPVRVSVGSTNLQPFQPNYALETAMATRTADAGAAPSTPIQPGKVTVTATVQVDYRYG